MANREEELLEDLRRTGEAVDDAIDLVETALIFAALDRPSADLAAYRSHLSELVEATRKAASQAGAPEEQVAALRKVLYADHGYAGDAETYEDMQNANLMSVIDRRKGLPVALGILCIHVASAQGWRMVGLSFPSHFLLQFTSGQGACFVDPFNALEVLDQTAMEALLKRMFGRDVPLDAEFCRPVDNRDILLRLQNNIRLRALQDGRTERALAVIDRMVLLAPLRGDLRLEQAVLQAKDGRLTAAIAGLEAFCDISTDEEMRQSALDLIARFKARLN